MSIVQYLRGGNIMFATEHLFSTPCLVMLCWRPEVSHGRNIYATDISKCYKLEPSLTPLPGQLVVNSGQHHTASTLSINSESGTGVT